MDNLRRILLVIVGIVFFLNLFLYLNATSQKKSIDINNYNMSVIIRDTAIIPKIEKTIKDTDSAISYQKTKKDSYKEKQDGYCVIQQFDTSSIQLPDPKDKEKKINTSIANEVEKTLKGLNIKVTRIDDDPLDSTVNLRVGGIYQNYQDASSLVNRLSNIGYMFEVKPYYKKINANLDCIVIKNISKDKINIFKTQFQKAYNRKVIIQVEIVKSGE